MVGQYLWRREEHSKKYDINATSNDEDELKGSEVLHVEIKDKEGLPSDGHNSETPRT